MASNAERLSRLDGSSRPEASVVTTTTSADAGSSRRTRRPQNRRTPAQETGGSRSRWEVIRNPEITRNTSTPTYPPGRAAVVIYHLWPAALPGGYVGVDVFLVISGFLITSHLLREPPVSLAGVLRFWGRRVRRLLPASALVVVVTTLASGLLLPSSLLRRSAFEAISSSLYVQNRSLAASASDYLAATAEATPFRHYWSLSVEEQFYLVWPLIIGGAVVVGWWAWRRRVGRGGSARTAGNGTGAQARRRAATWSVAGAVGLVIVGSLAWSVHLTATDPAAAYYATSTRMWELALGGAIAVVGTRLRAGPHLRSALAWAGLGAVALAAVTYDATT